MVRYITCVATYPFIKSTCAAQINKHIPKAVKCLTHDADCMLRVNLTKVNCISLQSLIHLHVALPEMEKLHGVSSIAFPV